MITVSFERSKEQILNTKSERDLCSISEAFIGGSRNRSTELTVGITGALRCATFLTSLGRYTCLRLIHTRHGVARRARRLLFLQVAGISPRNVSCIEH